MGGRGSGRPGGRPTLEGCGSCRLSTKDLREELRRPAGASLVLHHRVQDEPMAVRLQARPAQGCRSNPASTPKTWNTVSVI